jgi:cytochrome c551/c552
MAACGACHAVRGMHSKWKKVAGKWAKAQREEEADVWAPRQGIF